MMYKNYPKPENWQDTCFGDKVYFKYESKERLLIMWWPETCYCFFFVFF